jgi:hypothetical protein
VDVGTDLEEDIESHQAEGKKKSHVKPITTSMVDSWCRDIKSRGNLRAVRSLLRAFHAACHYGDDDGETDESAEKLGITVKKMLICELLHLRCETILQISIIAQLA